MPAAATRVRPIDQHVKGFTALGAKVMVEGGFINASTRPAASRVPTYIWMSFPLVLP